MGEDSRPDMVNRDPNGVNQNLQVAFEDVFGEPDSAHSPDCAWKCGYTCYEGAKGCCYKTLSVLCIWFYALCWGCSFACITFKYIWCCTPTLKTFKLTCGVVQELFATCINCCCGPICAAYGMMLSNIKVQIQQG